MIQVNYNQNVGNNLLEAISVINKNGNISTYITECNVPAILCSSDGMIVLMNDHAKKLLKTEIELPVHWVDYEKSCGFFERVENNEDTKRANSYNYYLLRKENEDIVKYHRYYYRLKAANSKLSFVCFYKNNDKEKIIPLTYRLTMEDICQMQEISRYNEKICNHLNLIVHDVKNALALSLVNLQVFNNLLTLKDAEGEYIKISKQEYEDMLSYANATMDGFFLQSNYVQMVEQLLEDQEGNINIIKSRFDIIENLKKAIYFYKAYVDRLGVTISFDSNYLSYYINTDKKRIDSAITNIIENAIKYTSQKETGPKEVNVSIGINKKHLRVIIRDTGIGISEEDLKHINEKYFRSDQEHNSDGVIVPYGKGLGLYTAYNYIRHLNGNIYCKSILNKGSMFVIALPLD